jgi:signal transduction histidine kinase
MATAHDESERSARTTTLHAQDISTLSTVVGHRVQVAPHVSRMARWFPTGRPLDDDTWRQRHRSVVRLVWLHVVGLGVFGLVRGYPAWHVGLEITAIAALAGIAMVVTSRLAQAASATLGLISCSALLVHLSGGLIEAHFHFFIMVGVVTLYQSWVPFGLAMVYVVAHHGTIGVIDPHSVYNHQAAINKPWLWAGIHGLFITGAALAGLRSWKFAEIERERAEEAAVRLRERTIREREAVELNDTVVQGLVGAKYAAQVGDAAAANEAIDRTLALAQRLVSDLMSDDARLFEPGGLRRGASVQ